MIFKLFSFLTKWAILSIVIFLIYVAVQQVYRTSANDPQIQMVGELSMDLTTGGNLERHFPKDSVDITKSGDLMAVIYDQDQHPIKSSGFMDGRIPRLPAGVFDFAKKQGMDKVSWEPRSGVRMAMVVAYLPSIPHPLFVAAGRSLGETEARVQSLSILVFIAWLSATLVLLFKEALPFGIYLIKLASANKKIKSKQ